MLNPCLYLPLQIFNRLDTILTALTSRSISALYVAEPGKPHRVHPKRHISHLSCATHQLRVGFFSFCDFPRRHSSAAFEDTHSLRHPPDRNTALRFRKVNSYKYPDWNPIPAWFKLSFILRHNYDLKKISLIHKTDWFIDWLTDRLVGTLHQFEKFWIYTMGTRKLREVKEGIKQL